MGEGPQCGTYRCQGIRQCQRGTKNNDHEVGTELVCGRKGATDIRESHGIEPNSLKDHLQFCGVSRVGINNQDPRRVQSRTCGCCRMISGSFDQRCIDHCASVPESFHTFHCMGASTAKMRPVATWNATQ